MYCLLIFSISIVLYISNFSRYKETNYHITADIEILIIISLLVISMIILRKDSAVHQLVLDKY